MTPLTLLPIIGNFPNDITDISCSAHSMDLLLMPPIAAHQNVAYLMAQCSQYLLKYWFTPYHRKSTTQERKISCWLESYYQFLLTDSRTVLRCDSGWMDGWNIVGDIYFSSYLRNLVNTSKETEI